MQLKDTPTTSNVLGIDTKNILSTDVCYLWRVLLIKLRNTSKNYLLVDLLNEIKIRTLNIFLI